MHKLVPVTCNFEHKIPIIKNERTRSTSNNSLINKNACNNKCIIDMSEKRQITSNSAVAIMRDSRKIVIRVTKLKTILISN